MLNRRKLFLDIKKSVQTQTLIGAFFSSEKYKQEHLLRSLFSVRSTELETLREVENTAKYNSNVRQL